MRAAFTRAQKSTIVSGVLSVAFVVDILQLWLLTATMNAYLGGDTRVVWPAAAVSAVCLALNVGLLRYIWLMDSARGD